MKQRFGLIGFLICAGFSFLQIGATSQRATDSGELKISTPKAEFILGEPIRLDTYFKNTGKFDVVYGEISVSDTWFKVYIAGDDGEFKQYKFKTGGSGHRRVQSDGVHLVTTSVFFNSKPETEGLSEYAIKQKTEGMILSDYAFLNAGTYRLKASLGFQVIDNSRSVKGDSKMIYPRANVESNEITIKINQPEGDNLKVWKIIESDTRIGYFMTAGQAPYRKPSIADSLLTEIDEIVADYPNSYLAGILRDKVADNRARREKSRIERQKFEEKVKNYKDPRN